MKITRKVHTGMAFVTAALLLLKLIFGFLTKLLSWDSTALSDISAGFAGNLLSALIGSAAVFFSILVLLRRRKDALAGVLFVFAVVVTAVAAVSGAVVSLYLLGMEAGLPTPVMAGVALNLLAGLLAMSFYLMLACECFQPGQISGSWRKIVLILLPLMIGTINVFAVIVSQLPLQDPGFTDYKSLAAEPLMRMGMDYIPLLLLGITLAIPVYERNPQDLMNHQ